MRIGNVRFNGGTVAITSVIVGVMVLLVFSFSVLSSISTMSPEIYFHVEDEVTTNVTVRIEGGVTRTIPQVPLGKEVVWKDVRITDKGAVHFQGREYPFLYYEGVFRYPDSNFGWCLEFKGTDLFINGVHSEQSASGFMMQKFLSSGLCEGEASFLLQRIMDKEMLETRTGYLLFRYIPMHDVDDVIHLFTSFDLSLMRRHFVLEECNGPVKMLEPEFEPVEDIGYLIHETAVNRL